MSSTMLAIDIAAGVLGVLAIVAASALVSRFVLGRVARLSAERIARQFKPDQIVRQDLVANFFGLESRGAAQLRGNGGLVLTRTELWFSRAVSEEVFEIPLQELLAAELVISHLGKTVGRKLLKVRFRTAAGEDSIAWSLEDAGGWCAQLQALVPRAA